MATDKEIGERLRQARKANWQVTMEAYSAGEELTCVVAIEWASRLLVITVY